MWWSSIRRTLLLAVSAGALAGMLSVAEQTVFGVVGEGHLWNMAFAIVTIYIVDTVFSYWFDDRWWFWPNQSVDQ